MDGFQTQVVARLPLAQTVYRILGHVLRDSVLDTIYDLFRGRGYEGEIRLRDLIWLVHDALFVHGSLNQAIEAAADLPAGQSSIYQKLGRMDIHVSMGLLRHASAQLDGLLADHSPHLPDSLSGFDVVVIDGKTFKHVAHRLKATRNNSGKATGGKMLAALSMSGELVRAIEITPDSAANDVKLVPGLLEQLQLCRQEGRVRLSIADRLFGGIETPLQFCAQGDHFLFRCQKNVGLESDPSRPAEQGVDERGRKYIQRWGWFGKARKLYGRRIEIKLSASERLILETDLVDEALYPAIDLLRAYHERASIARVFQQVTEVCELRHLIGSSPQGIAFQASFCMVMYNVLQVAKSHLAQGGEVSPREVSGELVFRRVTQEMSAWNMMVSEELTVQVATEPTSGPELRELLGAKLRPLWHERWRKSAKKKPTPAREKINPPSGTICVHRILQGKLPGRRTKHRKPKPRKPTNRRRRRSPT
jgi:hypothetical protein